MRLSILIILALIIGCTSKNEDGLGPEHTITTESGLQYYYLKKGTGPKVQVGSEVSTKLSLLVEDSLIWNSYEAEDSLYTFIAGVSSVIQGFEEMAFLMREGDNVVAILPYNIAYGEAGTGDIIPPYATLVYDRYELVSVSEPKIVLADSLLAVYNNGDVDEVKTTYESIMTSENADNYYSDIDLMGRFLGDLRANEQFEDLHSLATFFSTKASTEYQKALMGYYQVIALEEQEKFDQAIKLTNQYIKEFPEDEWFQARLTKLKDAKANAE